MQVSNQLKFIRAFVAAVRDPRKTEEIFSVIDNSEVSNQSSLRTVVARLRERAKCAELLDTRYLGNWDLDELINLPPESFGHIYAKHMQDLGLDPDFYPHLEVESEPTYMQMRVRQTHDIWHVLTGFDTSLPGEAGLQAFLQAQIRGRTSTMILAVVLLHGTLYQPALLPEIMDQIARGWLMGLNSVPLLGEKFEENWHRPLDDYRRDLKLEVVKYMSC